MGVMIPNKVARFYGPRCISFCVYTVHYCLCICAFSCFRCFLCLL